MSRWAPIHVALLQSLKFGSLHSRVDAALVLTVDRMNGAEKSAREYARQWGWSADKVIRFMKEDQSYINLSRDTDATPEACTEAGLQTVTRQQRDKTLVKVSATVARQSRDSDATPEPNIDAGLEDTTRQQRDTDATATRRLFIKEKEKKEDPCPSSPSKDLFDLWNKTAEGTPLSKVRELNGDRQKKCLARLKERSLDEWGDIFKRLALISNSMQSNKGQWMCFDWVIKNTNNATKVLEGQYDWLSNTSRPSDSRYNEIFVGA